MVRAQRRLADPERVLKQDLRVGGSPRRSQDAAEKALGLGHVRMVLATRRFPHRERLARELLCHVVLAQRAADVGEHMQTGSDARVTGAVPLPGDRKRGFGHAQSIRVLRFRLVQLGKGPKRGRDLRMVFAELRAPDIERLLE